MGRRRIERTESVTGTLENDIVEGRLAPGERLDERSLAERFGVSRTPIREALRRLGAIGLVEETSGQGSIVAQASLDDIAAMFELLVQLEGTAARLAAQRIDAASARELTIAARSSADIAPSDDPLAYSRVNLVFHEIIYRASGNGFLETAIRQVSARAAVYRRQAFGLPGWAARSAAEHLAIAEAITAHDPECAQALMAIHVNVFGRPDTPRLTALLTGSNDLK